MTGLRDQDEPRTPTVGPSVQPAKNGIAIVGMSCLFPAAPDLDSYWRNILGKVDAVSDPPAEAWDPRWHYDPDSTEIDRVYCRRGGYISPLASFDPLAHGIPPLAVGGEPDQWLALQLARDALDDAGYERLPDSVRKRTTVVLGKGTYVNAGNALAMQHGLIVAQTLQILRDLHPEFTEADLETLRKGLRHSLPPMGPETVPGLIPNVIVGRIANRLDLMGPTYTVDAACASSLVAVQLAVRDLRDGTCDLAIAGGSQVWMPVVTLGVFCQLGALSRRQQIKPFDKDADGTLLGEGIGMLVLKRVEDAERDGDRIYAVIRGVGVASDGRGLSVMAPRVEGEELALRRAYEAAGVDPNTVGLIEAHGTGTPVGDQTEIQALTRVFGARTTLLPPCAIGSVKSMISHTIPAAGVAGLIKTSLALYHRVLPPTLHCEQPHPRLELHKTPFYINTSVRPWIHGAESPRRAGVNAFGFGGINAHAVLEEPGAGSVPTRAGLRTHRPGWDSEVFLLSDDSIDGLRRRVEQMSQFVAARESRSPGGSPDGLADLASGLASEFSSRADARTLAIVANSWSDLGAKLQRASSRLADPSCRKIREVSGIYYAAEPLMRSGRLAFLVPGEGAQYPGMLADLCLHFPEVRAAFDRMDRLSREQPRGFVPSDYIFPRAAFTPEEARWAEERLWQMEGAVEAVLAADEAVLALLDLLKIVPDAIVGHSSGEYAALLASGVLDLTEESDRSRFARDLHRIYEEAAVGDDVGRVALLAIGGPRAQVEALARRFDAEANVAMDNCPHQVVVAVDPDQAPAIQEAAAAAGLITERLAFDRPYHTPRFSNYAERLREAFACLNLRPARLPVVSCTTGDVFPTDPAAIRSLMVEHWVRPVEFRSTIETLHDRGFRLFVEAGPRGNLTAFVEDILRGRPFCAIAANTQRRSGLTQLNHLVGLLASHGVPLDATALFRHRDTRPLRGENDRSEHDATAVSRSALKIQTGFPAMSLPAEVRSQLSRPVAPAPASTPATTTTTAEAPSAFDTPPAADSPFHDLLPKVAPGIGSGSLNASAHAFLDTMDQFLVVQQRVMSELLALGSGSSAAAFVAPESPMSAAVESSSPSPTHPRNGSTSHNGNGATAVSPVPRSHEPPARGDLSRLLFEIVSERTGYPVDMLDLDSDLEADLGIDSIKRVEILGTVRRRSEALAQVDLDSLASSRTLRQVLDSLDSAAVRDRSAATPRLPLVGTIVAHEVGRTITVRRTFDPDEDRYLHDHVLGREPAAESAGLFGLAVLPLTMSLEILAETAVSLIPERKLIRLENVRAHRWIAFDDGPRTLETTARRSTTDPDEVILELRDPTEPSAGAIVQAVARFGDDYPPAPDPLIMDPADSRPSSLVPERLYRDLMFHGPTWRGVQAIEQVGPGQISAQLEVLSFRSFFRSDPEPRFVLDPITLDAAGQVIGFWTAEQLETGRIIFPFQVDALAIFGPLKPPGERLRCVARVRLLGDQVVSSDIDLVTADGRLWLRLSGWQDKRFDLPGRLHSLIAPDGRFEMTEVWSGEGPNEVPDPESVGRILHVDGLKDRAFWKRVWAARLLHKSEQAAFRRLAHESDSVTMNWLARRQVAKEAIRSLLEQRQGLSPCLGELPVSFSSDTEDRAAFDGTGAIPGRIDVTIRSVSGSLIALARAVR